MISIDYIHVLTSSINTWTRIGKQARDRHRPVGNGNRGDHPSHHDLNDSTIRVFVFPARRTPHTVIGVSRAWCCPRAHVAVHVHVHEPVIVMLCIIGEQERSVTLVLYIYTSDLYESRGR